MKFIKRFPKHVNIIDSKSVFIEKTAVLGRGVTVYPNNVILGKSEIGNECVLMPGNCIINSKIDACCVVQSSAVEDSVIGANCAIGPMAHIREGSDIKEGCRVGNFCEIKSSMLGTGSKVAHLSYIGNARTGRECNIGCGVVFANYDGKRKRETILGNHVFVGCNCNLVAPIKIEDNAYICAGTTVTKDVTAGDFVIGRVRPTIKAGDAYKYWGEVSKEDG